MHFADPQIPARNVESKKRLGEERKVLKEQRLLRKVVFRSKHFLKFIYNNFHLHQTVCQLGTVI